MLRFHPQLLYQAQSTKTTFLASHCQSTKCKAVSLHLRLTDYSGFLRKYYSLADVLTTDYIERAMEYIHQKYRVSPWQQSSFS